MTKKERASIREQAQQLIEQNKHLFPKSTEINLQEGLKFDLCEIYWPGRHNRPPHYRSFVLEPGTGLLWGKLVEASIEICSLASSEVADAA